MAEQLMLGKLKVDRMWGPTGRLVKDPKKAATASVYHTTPAGTAGAVVVIKPTDVFTTEGFGGG